MTDQPVKELEVFAPFVSVDAGTGGATIRCTTDQGPIQLNLAADVFLFLRDQIAQRLAEARHGGLYMLPSVVGYHGLEASIGRSQLQIRLIGRQYYPLQGDIEAIQRKASGAVDQKSAPPLPRYPTAKNRIKPR
jgi:hypothetical protein